MRLSDYTTDEKIQMLNEYLESKNDFNSMLLDFSDSEEFFETYYSGRISEAVRAWSFGQRYGGGDNCWGHEYIYFNGYANICTICEYDCDEYIEDYREGIEEYFGLDPEEGEE